MNTRRLVYFVAAATVFAVALFSPLATLAKGHLFSAHMLQHILLVLIVPAFLLLSLMRDFSLPRWLTNPFVGWIAGVGAMWLWHAPALCSAANTSRSIFALQTTSHIIMGSLFWWQVLAPRQEQRLSPPAAIVYLFTACTACSVLGIIITFAPVSVCPAFQNAGGKFGLTSDRDQQIGGLLMWVPMCAIYAAAILAQMARWHSSPQPEQSNA